MKYCATIALLATILAFSGCSEQLKSDSSESLRLTHDVYFTLNDNSPQARDSLIAACYKYLSNHPGVVYFSAGDIVSEHQREVNVRDWDVALHIVFKTKAHHDAYQNAADHHKFIEENQSNWKTVRVFDSFVR